MRPVTPSGRRFIVSIAALAAATTAFPLAIFSRPRTRLWLSRRESPKLLLVRPSVRHVFRFRGRMKGMRSSMDVQICAWGMLALATLVGCGSDAPPLGQVTGTVTLDGKPVDGAMIQFEPTTSGMPTAFGQTDAQGKYELWYSRGNKGASLGEAIVRITAFQEADDDSAKKKRPEIVPAKYNLTSELKVEV